MSINHEIVLTEPKSFLEGFKSIKYFSSYNARTTEYTKLIERHKNVEGFLTYLKENTKLHIPDEMTTAELKTYVTEILRRDTPTNTAHYFKILDLPPSALYKFVCAFAMVGFHNAIKKMFATKELQYPIFPEGESEYKTLFIQYYGLTNLSALPTEEIMNMMLWFPENERDYWLREKIINKDNGSTLLHYKCQKSKNIKDIITLMKHIPFDYSPSIDPNNKPYDWFFNCNSSGLFKTKLSEFKQAFKEAYDAGDILCENEESYEIFMSMMGMGSQDYIQQKINELLVCLPSNYRGDAKLSIEKIIASAMVKHEK